MKVQGVRGTSDILPGQAQKWQALECRARRIFKVFCCQEVRTPILESQDLFVRSVGETTDIVEKQMYTIPEPEGPGLTLRPEGTAPIVRAMLEHGLDREDRLVKVYYIGPMFRRERPQKGRLRQFHQIGVEAMGSYHPRMDAEVIWLAARLLEESGLEGSLLKLNSVGCRECKARYGETLKEALRGRVNDLCDDCRRRFDRNVLRILDCKNEQCQQAAGDIPLPAGQLCGSCMEHFETVKGLLKALDVGYELSGRLVRGLDYYTRTIFEFTHPALGAQDAIGAGGRYDHLIESLGGSPAGAAGFAFGMERLVLALGEQAFVPGQDAGPDIFLVSLGEDAALMNFLTQRELRQNGIMCEMDFDAKSAKSQFRRADKRGARYVLVRGQDEIAGRTVKIKDMRTGVQEDVAQDKIVDFINPRLKT